MEEGIEKNGRHVISPHLEAFEIGVIRFCNGPEGQLLHPNNVSRQ